MKKQTNKLFATVQHYKRSRAQRHRGLRMELLEGRRVMAGDSLPMHNGLIAEDVNKDFSVSPLDALLVINALHRQSKAAGEGEGGSPTTFVDVSGDGVVSPIDALLVINRLNAEGEGGIVSYTMQITDSNGTPITQVAVGQTFTVRLFVQDIRPEADATGVFSAGLDLDIDASAGETESGLVRFPAVSTQTFLQGIRAGTRLNTGKAGERGVDGSTVVPPAVDPNEEFNEISLFDGNTTFPELRDPPIDATRIESFFSADFVALKPGSISFAPSAADTAQAETLFYGDSASIPASSQMFSEAITITILADPTSPVAVNDVVTTLEDTAIDLATAGLTLNDTVAAGRTLTVTAVTAIAGTTLGTISGLVYTPPANSSSQDRVTYTVIDSSGLTSTATVTINVTPVNDAPIAVADAFNVVGDSIDNPLNVLVNDNAGPGETQTLSITSVSATSNGGTVTPTNNNTSLLYTPAPGFDGTETFSYVVSDGGLTASALVTITVEPGVRPFARRDTATLAEISAGGTGGIAIPVLANDAVNPGAGVQAVLVSFQSTSANGGTITRNENGTPADLTDDTLQYVPAFEFNGADTFTYTMNDTLGTGANSTATVTVTVTDVNDAPTAVNDNATGTEDTALTIASSTLLVNDAPGLGETTTQTLSITSVATTSGSVAIVGSNVVYTPAADVNGTRTFTYTITDSGTPALTATATVTVTLAAVNDAPVAGADSVSTNEDTVRVITAASLLTNDAPGPATATDEAAQVPLTITAVAKPAATLGTVTLNAGSITYTPALNFNGTESFTYTVQDSAGASSTGTVTVTVNPINDAPLPGVDAVTAFKGAVLQIPVADLLVNDSPGPANESGQTPLSILAVSNAVNGTVSLNTATGIITFTPANGFSGAASFQYTVQDSGPSGGTNVNSAIGTVNVTVRDFVPTVISGTVFVDETNDGIIDAAERRLGSVEVVLTGNALGVPIQPQTYVTLADGSYHFDNLAPGQYVVTYRNPSFMIDGRDVAGGLGDADSVANQFTINVAQPGGLDATGYNFASLGIEPSYGRTLDLLASRYFAQNSTFVYNGIVAALGPDNSLLWIAKLQGFDAMVAGEIVINAAGNRVQVTMVDANRNVFTTSLSPDKFVVTTDRTTGNRIVRVLGDASSLNFQQINLAAPPVVSINGYLDAIDEIFAQEDWDD